MSHHTNSPPTGSGASKSMVSPLAAYLFGVGSWFSSMGLQFVMIPTLAIIVLGVSANELAIVQMTLSIPQLLLLLYAGSLADKTNARTVLLLIHILAALPPMALGWLVYFDQLAYVHLIIFALSVGLLSSFAMPTRDALLTRVTSRDIQSAVMMALITQFSAQLLGFILAGAAASLAGPRALLALQTLAILIGLVATLFLPSLPPLEKTTDEDDPNHVHDRGWRTGYHIVIESKRLYPVFFSTLSVGIFFIGIFMVALPLTIRNVFDGGQFEIAVVNVCFWGGTIVTTMVLLNRHPIRRRGRAMVLAVMVGSLSLIGVSLSTDFYMVCGFVTGWGLCAGVNMAMSRTIMQTEAPAQARARVLAFYNLGFLGAAPLGAMCAGFATELLGPQLATGIFAGMMIVFTLWLITSTPVWVIDRHEDEA
jgi:MFS family permease